MRFVGLTLPLVIATACATTPAQKAGLAREAIATADAAFSSWYIEKQEAATEIQEVERLIQIRQRWEQILAALVEGTKEAEKDNTTRLDAARAAAREFLAQIGIRVPEAL